MGKDRIIVVDLVRTKIIRPRPKIIYKERTERITRWLPPSPPRPSLPSTNDDAAGCVVAAVILIVSIGFTSFIVVKNKIPCGVGEFLWFFATMAVFFSILGGIIGGICGCFDDSKKK